ncbi:MAG: SMC family ATPase [Lachnospiraceae bacterium]|nr:SMC family ATPase [Lachnospiraceae bacterium]
MRPINLVISAFGPYADKVDIDFNSFLDKGIYLISGNTGAGKSTIFEAIKFVLYGEDNGEIRSKYAMAETPTFVDMTFMLRGKEYRVTRNPKYSRPKSRGEGFTTAKAEAELVYHNGKIITGYSNVTKEIVNLTGLNSDQFSKIVMIAQGKFRELLETDTANRSKIFRDIFKTESYDKLQKKVKAKYIETYKENSKTIDSIKQFIQGIIINESFSKRNALEKIMKQDIITDIDETIELTNMLISEDEICYKNNISKMEVSQEEISRLNNNINGIISSLKEIEALERELNKYSIYVEENKEIVSDYESVNSLKEQREQLYADIETLKKTVEKYKQYDEVMAKLKKVNIDELLIGEVLTKLQKEKNELQIKLDETSEKVILKSEYEKKIIKLDSDIKSSTEYIQKLEKILELGKRLDEASKAYEEKVEVLKTEEKLCANLRLEYNDKFLLYIEAQAGIMANELRKNPGMPCPVCGATEYIRLAENIKEAPTEDEVSHLKEKLDKATDKVMKASANAGNIMSDRDNLRGNLIIGIEEAKLNCSVDDYKEKANEAKKMAAQQQKNLKNSQDECSRELVQLQKVLDEIPLLKETLQKLEDDIKNTEIQMNENKLKTKELETIIEAIKLELKDNSEEETRSTLKSMEEKYVQIVERIEKTISRYSKHIADMAASKAIIEQFVKKLKDLGLTKTTNEEIINVKVKLIYANREYTEKLRLVEEAYSKLVDDNNNVYLRIENNKRIVASVEVQRINLQNLGKRLSSLKNMSDTLNGELEGKDKIKLETFVQISYFEQVIERANTKLFEMTEGQYEFIRDMSSEDKRTKSGLDLCVLDHYNGTVRSVKTLSGGEGFMAALSLALGMADIIEESASGISIDTMFIDEGFGSLDEMALEQAMRVLAKLSEGNKLVGIISHVSSLKDRIEKQINVEKKMSGGSLVKVVV